MTRAKLSVHCPKRRSSPAFVCRKRIAKRVWWAVPVWAAMAVSSFAQSVEDVIYLQDGRERVGRLVEINEAHVLFEVKGPESHTSCMPKIVTEVKVKGDISEEQLKTIERLVHYSPVHGMVEYANSVESRVSRA